MASSNYLELLICAQVLNIITLSESVQEAFDTIQTLKERIIEKINETEDKDELRQLEYCKNAAEMLKPMNASGYFEIGKSTLTSMLSVR